MCLNPIVLADYNHIYHYMFKVPPEKRPKLCSLDLNPYTTTEYLCRGYYSSEKTSAYYGLVKMNFPMARPPRDLTLSQLTAKVKVTIEGRVSLKESYVCISCHCCPVLFGP